MSEQSRDPGWYQDPFGTGPHDRRYWDGETWLAVQQTQPAAFEAPGAPAQQPESHEGPPYGPPHQQSGWGEQPSAPQWGLPAADGDRERTPDGAPLASWGRRWAAYAIDWAIIQLVTFAIAGALGLVAAANAAFAPLIATDTSQDPTATSAQVEDAYVGFLTEQAGTLLAMSALVLLASGAYHVVLVALRGRTIGKRVVGIRVRLREREGLPIWRASASRWLLHYALPNLLSSVPGLGLIGLLLPFVDGLWPLWDARRQAIHDKVAKTSVVRG